MDESLIFFISVFGVFMLILVGVAFNFAQVDDDTLEYHALGGTSLPIPSMEKNKGPWYISWFDTNKYVRVQGGNLRVDLKKGGYGGGSGLQLRANPYRKFPASSAWISYDIFVPSDFPWNNSGKIGAGFCLGTGPGNCSTGGDWSDDSGSIRVSWDGPRKAVTPYVYIPTQVGGGSRKKSIENQGSSFKSIIRLGGSNGVHLWYKNPFPLKAGQWNTVSLVVRLNTPGKSDGYLRFRVNGLERTLSNILWRSSSNVKISNVLFSVFYGGSNSSYAAPRDTYVMYRNFSVGTGT